MPKHTTPLTRHPFTHRAQGAACALALGAALCVGATACSAPAGDTSTSSQQTAAASASQHELVASVSSQLDTLKAQGSDALLASDAGIDASTLEAYGLNESELAQAYLDGFDYRIQDVSINGDHASAQVVITCKSTAQLEQNLQDDIGAATVGSDFTAGASAQQNALIGAAIMQAIAETGTVQTDAIPLSLSKASGSWTLDANSAQAVYAAVMNS